MLNRKTVEVLKSIAGISAEPTCNKVVISYPFTYVVSPGGDIIVKYDIRATEIGEFENIAVYNINNLLSVFSLFGDERSVAKNNNILTVSNGSSSSNFLLAEKLVEFKDYGNIFDSVEAFPSVCEFVVDKDTLKSIRGASGVFKELTEYIIKTNDSGVNIALAAENSFNAQSNSYNVNFLAKSDKEFSIKFPIANINILPVSDYAVKVKYNATRDKYRIILESTEIENFKILLSPLN